ncbi:CASP8 and FADD-like apoptosis regulator isoform X1 [Alosa sapidissima]|uniref:CASP8 and FADD-like apoptosis regulator isoform X1 n=1 Tax=Alosa sapidissima TaxID=34773 RepID=UPI001C09D8F1|nr:CASP8 and FADD-like apoptosis regulator isoform X1 [Alosa sapidissima]
MTAQLSLTIKQIAESLSFAERKTLLYLSGVEDVNFASADIRNVLSCVTNVVDMDVFLMELMFRMRRFDILKKVLRASRTEVDEILRTVQFVSDYRVLMVDLSDNIGAEDLRSIGFLLSSSLSRERLDGMQSFLDIVTDLEKQGEVSNGSMDLIEQCLKSIHRIDLVKKINKYKEKVAEIQGTSVSNHTSGIKNLRKSEQESRVTPEVSNEKWELLRLQKNDRMSCRPTKSERISYQNSLDVYRLQAQPRGVCVIIDCVGYDGDRLEQTFKCLHFHVIMRKLLSVTDCLSTLREVAQLSCHCDADAFACCLISRASESHLLGTEAQASGLSLDAVRHLFNSNSCPGLVGKPKLFFVQSYSAFEPPRSAGCSGYYSYWDKYLETDGPAVAYDEAIPTSADVFWSHCWTQETALKEQNHQSAYLQALQSSLLNGQQGKRNLLDVHMVVNQKIFEHNDRNPTQTYGLDLRHTLRKMLFLS